MIARATDRIRGLTGAGRASWSVRLTVTNKFLLALSLVSKKRTTYKELTGKTDAATTPEPFESPSLEAWPDAEGRGLGPPFGIVA